MNTTFKAIFLFDVDNTLIDNDRMKTDLGEYVRETFGAEAEKEFWTLYDEQRVKHDYADFIGTLERFRCAHIQDMRTVRLSNWVLNYPFEERLYPDAVAAVHHVSQWGLPVILTDGDGVFQPHKLESAGLIDAFGGNVLNYVHKEKELDNVLRAYPAEHYVLIDDKLKLLDAFKRALGDRVTTVFPCQGHYAEQQSTLENMLPADIEINRIAELMEHDFSERVPA
ncbi:MAG: HAD family hydrolase [Pseudomonadota bacterium]